MKLSPLFLMAGALAAGLLPAPAQDAKPLPARPPEVRPLRPDEVLPPPGSNEAAPASATAAVPELGANYRIVISAMEHGQKTGEISAQTCSSTFQIHGCFAMPVEEDSDGTDIAIRGVLSELDGGRLRLSYSLALTNRVPSQTLGMPGEGQAVVSNYGFKTNGATGMLLLQPGRSCELMQISGVAYSLSITPMETWPAAKPSAKAPANTSGKATAAPGEEKAEAAARRGPTDEDRARYESLSDRGREKFRDAVRALFTQPEFRNAPEEERRAGIRKAFEEAEAEDKARNK